MIEKPVLSLQKFRNEKSMIHDVNKKLSGSVRANQAEILAIINVFLDKDNKVLIVGNYNYDL